MQEIFKLNEYFQKDFKISYWQTNHGKEVDVVLSRGLGQPLVAVEIKSAENVDEANLKGIFEFGSEYPIVKLLCFSRTPRAYKIQNVTVLPWAEGLELLKTI